MRMSPNGKPKLTLSDFFQLFIIGLIGLLPLAVVAYQYFFIAASVKEPTTNNYAFGVLSIVVAAFISATNSHFAFIRPWLYRRKHGNFDNYKNVSGIPVIGGLFVVIAALYLPSSHLIGVLLLLVYLSDIGSIPWFFVQLLRHGL